MRHTRKAIIPAENASSGRANAGHARAKSLTPEERKEIARDAANARWSRAKTPLLSGDVIDGAAGTDLPEAKWKGTLNLSDHLKDIPCYVLSDGRSVIGRTSSTEMLTGIKGGGDLEKYLGVRALQSFINVEEVQSKMVDFRLPEVEGLERRVRGLTSDQLIEICRGFVAALEASTRPDTEIKLTSRQIEMAMNASMFLAACAKVGLEALIHEVTGYQYERANDALEVKLRAYLEVEMRKWEKTFPDELWVEFGRLTNWTRNVTQRPKYWGHLVNDLVYEYLDPDVTKWLKENAPQPVKGRNYHQWLTAQFGLKKLVEHIWKLIGIAKTCTNMSELKDKMAEIGGKRPVQYRLFLPYKE